MTGPGSVLIVGGASALDTNPQVAASFGPATGHYDGGYGYGYGYGYDAYVAAIVDAFGLVPDPDGEVTLRVSSDLHPALAVTGAVPVAVVAVDLVDSLSTREHSPAPACCRSCSMSLSRRPAVACPGSVGWLGALMTSRFFTARGPVLRDLCACVGWG
jgi:hypothetical protein